MGRGKQNIKKIGEFSQNKLLNSKKTGKILFSNSEISDKVRYLVKTGKAVKIGPRLYSLDPSTDHKELIKNNIWEIVAGYFPDGILIGRTALEFKISAVGNVFLASEKKKTIDLDGIKIISSGPLNNSDQISIEDFMYGLRKLSFEDALQENSNPSYKGSKSQESKTFSIEEFKEYIKRLSLKNNQSLTEIKNNTLQEKIKKILAEPEAFVDTRRSNLFKSLSVDLSSQSSSIILENGSQDKETFAFFEAYFSNYIEGIEFNYEQTKHLLLEGKIIKSRREDSLDLINTFKFLKNPIDLPEKETDYLEFCKDVHSQILAGRKNINPGKIKNENNRVGSYQFVDKSQVEGTFRQATIIGQELSGFEKAIFYAYVISEIHPFLDGNGRISRILLNSILEKEGLQKIIIPSIYRNNYLSSLSALSNSDNPDPYYKTMLFAQKYNNKLKLQNIESAHEEFAKTNAFLKEYQAEIEGKRLRIPE